MYISPFIYSSIAQHSSMKLKIGKTVIIPDSKYKLVLMGKKNIINGGSIYGSWFGTNVISYGNSTLQIEEFTIGPNMIIINKIINVPELQWFNGFVGRFHCYYNEYSSWNLHVYNGDVMHIYPIVSVELVD